VPGFHIASDDDLQFARTGATVSTFSIEDDSTIQRVSGGTGNYNWLAYTLVLLMPLNLYWWHAYPSLRSRVILLALTGMQLAALVLTYTRSAFIGLLAAGLYLVMKREVKLWLPATAIGIALITLPLWAPDRFAERMLSREYFSKGTTVIRTDFIVTGIGMFRDKWVLGHGYGQFGEYFLRHSTSEYVTRMQEEIDRGAGAPHSIRPHNMYVDVAVDYGIIGLAAFLWLLTMLLRDLREAERHGEESERRIAVLLQASLIAFCVCGFFGHNSIMRAPWAIAGLVAAVRRVALETPDNVAAARHRNRGVCE
jgi:O-antigen ligase